MDAKSLCSNDLQQELRCMPNRNFAKVLSSVRYAIISVFGPLDKICSLTRSFVESAEVFDNDLADRQGLDDAFLFVNDLSAGFDNQCQGNRAAPVVA